VVRNHVSLGPPDVCGRQIREVATESQTTIMRQKKFGTENRSIESLAKSASALNTSTVDFPQCQDTCALTNPIILASWLIKTRIRIRR
jgi:hypothetical protein